MSLVSVSSFASGKNLVVCGQIDGDDSVTIRKDAGGQLVGLFSMLDHGTLAYKVELVPTPAHIVGAGLVYEGQGLSLHINTDGAPNKEGIYSVLTIPSLDITGETFRCKLLN